VSRRFHYKGGPLEEANEELDSLWRRVDEIAARKLSRVQAQVGMTETEVRHGLGRTPKDVRVLPRSDARIWQTRNPSDTSVFLAASVVCMVDVTVE